MIKDLMKFLDVEKAVEYREKLMPTPRYVDGMETLLNRIHPRFQKVKIVKIEKKSKNVKLLRFVASNPERPLAFFNAGQYIGVKVNINGVHTSRAYSLVSSPNNIAYYEIAVKNLGEKGFVSNFLNEEAKIGDILNITEPMGSFYYNSIFHGKDLVFIAGGCGVTPFISMIREVYEKDLPFSIHLIYGCLSEDDRLFLDELEVISSERENIKISWVLSEPSDNWNGLKGFITKDILSKLVDNWTGKMVYFVGPDLMKGLILKNLKSLGVLQHRILCEIAPPPQDISELNWSDSIKKDKTMKCVVNWVFGGKFYRDTIDVISTEPLINSIERAKLKGVIVNNACRSGECALCRSHLISGEVFVPQNILIREVDKKFGYIHPCVSYPISDLEIELFIS